MDVNRPNFKKICLMHIQQLTNFPYIEKDFDALTDYEFLCKVVEYLNEVITNNNEQNETITSLYNAFVELKDYVEKYFENLDVQDEINNKLDAMAQDGSLTNLIRRYLDPIIYTQNSRISAVERQVTSAVTGTPIVVSDVSSMTDTDRIYVNTTDDKWYYYNGTEWTIGGDYLADNTINSGVNELVLNDIYGNEVDQSEATFSLGGLNVNNGDNTVSNTRCRAATFYTYSIDILELTSNLYKYNVLYYDIDGNFLHQTSTWRSDRYLIIPSAAKRFKFMIAKLDDSIIDDEDIAAMKSSVKFYKMTDSTLTDTQNRLPNNHTVKNNIEIQKEVYQVERVIHNLEVSSFTNYQILKSSGFRLTTVNNYYTSTQRLTINLHGPRIVYNNSDYNLTVFYYSDATGAQNGTYYEGFVDYGTSADFIALYPYFSLQFTKVDESEFTSADKTNIINSIKYYQASKNKYFSGYRRFEIENDINGVPTKIKGILSLPENYTQNGKPVKILAMLHGGSAVITDSQWYGNEFDALATLAKNNGFAVFDINRLPENEDYAGRTYGGRLSIENIKLAFRWIKEHFNVEEKMYMMGASMGGATALSYVMNYGNDVISCSCFAPVNNISSIHLIADKDMYAQCFGYADEAAAMADGYKNIIGYAPALTLTRHDVTTNEFKPYNLESLLPVIVNDYNSRFWNNNTENLNAHISVPTKIWLGSDDATIDLPFMRKYAKALQDSGCNVLLHEYANATHGDITYARPSGMKEEWIEFLKMF